ncbi:MAG: hypothetical protein LBJ43_01110 [Propionibacteriaceae bacterium]|jgi:DNA-directed RNA polymerase sigma subunit (sigma70/sigma32)|nr:hypothetical protein [Propionibacteriaceae bacterium]
MSLELPSIELNPADEVLLAKRMEAGWYAEHLLSEAPNPGASLQLLDELVAVRDDGIAAWQEAFIACLRLVRRLALKYALRVSYDVEDTFQSGCLTLAKALRTWDYRGEARMTTYVWRAVERSLRDYCCLRGGRMEAPIAVVRAGLFDPETRVWRPPRMIGDPDLLAAVITPSNPSAHELLAGVWSKLQPLSARVLAARHGIGTSRLAAAELAAQLQMSTRALRRVERQAEAELRYLLTTTDAEPLALAS